MTYKHFLFWLEQLEQIYPHLTPDEMAHKLRVLAPGYNDASWKEMLNNRDEPPFETNDKATDILTNIKLMLEHGFDSNTQVEKGVIKLNDGNTVAFGKITIIMQIIFIFHKKDSSYIWFTFYLTFIQTTY